MKQCTFTIVHSVVADFLLNVSPEYKPIPWDMYEVFYNLFLFMVDQNNACTQPLVPEDSHITHT